MSNVGEPERKTQDRVVQLFQRVLGYDYLGNWAERPNNRNIEPEFLRPVLRARGYSETLITKALHELSKAADDQSRSLYQCNKAVYGLLRYGIPVKENVGETSQTVWLIDWQNPLANHFALAEEVTVKGPNPKRPDVVLYVNGIALGVLELKRSTVAVSQGIRQNLDNQNKLFIQPFFTTMQLVLAGNDSEGLRYGTIQTREKYYLTWKEEQSDPLLPANALDRHLIQLCHKARFLELIHDFTVFDSGTKKLCRHNQYFGVKAAQARVRQREGGILWHTQGSGKSLTMVWLAKWLRENITDARVLIITDRTELDEQIEKVFLGVNEAIVRCRSGADLLAKLNAAYPALLCSLIHKFGSRPNSRDGGRDGGRNGDTSDYAGFIADLQRHLPKDFRAKGDLYVFVDECHRTQTGELHKAMKQLLPHALFIGFTGTPLLKADKQTSLETFGRYIHTYKFDEAVADKVVLDLRYEARDIDQSITSSAKIDQWFAAKTKGLNDYALSQLKRKWGTMQRVLSSQSRLEKIVADILLDMATKPRLLDLRGNAMLVAGSIYQACKFYELFQQQGLAQCAIVTSYAPAAADIKGEETGEGLTERLKQYAIYQKMLDGQTPEAFEAAAKATFVKEPGQMRLLIVVDKLLTGFDAPSATYLYIDKTMQDHGLFQAICRVNRLDGDDKEYGYIIDYKDLFQSLESSIHDYTSGALDGYAKEDVAGLLSDRLTKAQEQLEAARESIKALCEAVAPPKAMTDYLHYFCGDTANPADLSANAAKRLALYQQTAALVRAYANLANELSEAGYTPKQIAQIKEEVDHYEKVRSTVKLASGDYIDLKTYEPAMRHLIDTYIRAEESEVISAFDDLSLIQLIVARGVDGLNALPKALRQEKGAMAETIENNLRRVILDEQPVNPKYYEKMSQLLDELIKERRDAALHYEAYLARIVELAKAVHNPAGSVAYPPTLDTAAKRALYDNLDHNADLALDLDSALRRTKKDGWRGVKIKEREVRYVVNDHIPDPETQALIFELIKQQAEY